MSATALLIGFVLAGQVSSSTDRYNDSGGQPAAKSGTGGATTGTDRVPLFSQPPSARDDGGSQRNSTTPASGNADPYAQQRNATTTSGQRPPSGFSPPPGIGATRSPFGELPSQGNASGPGATASPPAAVKPSAMMRAMLTPPRDSQLSGSPVRLLDVVAGAKSRLEQTQRVDAYWDLCSSAADYYLALREQAELEQLRATLPRVSPLWEQAESELIIRLGTSQRAAVTSQMRLAGWLGRGTLPLPYDLPHCGSYHTRYEEIFAGRPSAEAQELAALLPLRYTELKDAASAVTRAEEWIKTVARGDSDGSGTLTALEFLALRRRAFVQIARDYNRRIARYTELASPGEIGAERLVGMLIKLESSSTATRPASPGAQPGRQSRNSSSIPPQTFAEGQGWAPVDRVRPITRTRDDSVVPAGGSSRQEPQQQPRRERSLLVSPR